MMVSMDPAIHRGEMPLADRYRRFARREARGVSLVYETWAEAVADDDAVLSLLNTLPPGKQQPNLVFAAARLHGADSTYDSFRSEERRVGKECGSRCLKYKAEKQD